MLCCKPVTAEVLKIDRCDVRPWSHYLWCSAQSSEVPIFVARYGFRIRARGDLLYSYYGRTTLFLERNRVSLRIQSMPVSASGGG